MEFLKALFESGALTWEQFSAAVTDKGYKLVDLSSGNYVSKLKYDDDIQTRDTTISDLNTQIANRDTDIATLQSQLTDGSKDSETKISDLTSQIATLQSNYEAQKTDYESKLSAQQYEFAVRNFAGKQKFSSNAAKRDFIKEMISANLTMQDKTIMGADDFATKYRETNSDAFVADEPAPPAQEPENKPTFIQPTPPTPPEENPFNFNFQGI